MTSEMLREELFGRTQGLVARARDRGHDLHLWHADTSYSHHTACRACGARLAVAVTVSKTETIDTAAKLDCRT